jgi:hypothetical protein
VTNPLARHYSFRSRSGSFAITFDAMRRASSRVSRLAAERRLNSSSKMDVSKLLAVVVAHHKRGA